MKKTYFSYSFYIFFVIFALLLWLEQWGVFLLLFFLVYGRRLFFSQKMRSLHRRDAFVKKGVVYSPVNGRILSIKKGVDHAFFGENLNECRISVPWWEEYGLYLPFASEIIDLTVKKRGCSLYRFKKSKIPSQETVPMLGLAFLLRSAEGVSSGIQLVKCPLGLWPKVGVIPGDRGKCRANIGHFPLGGTVFLYLPSQYEILVYERQKVTAGLTRMATAGPSEI